MAAANISRPVAHITQQDEDYCWACALAMVLGRHSWDDALQIADRVPMSARDSASGQLCDVAAAARAVNLTPVPATGFSPAQLAQRMGTSAAAVFGIYDTGRGEFSHVMVVSLLRGELSDPSAVTVGADDPYALGTRWIGPWNRWYGAGLVLRQASWIVSR